MPAIYRAFFPLIFLAACAQVPEKPSQPATASANVTPAAITSATPCKCPDPEVKPPPAAPAWVAASFADLPGWQDDDLQPAFNIFLAQCSSGAQKTALWRAACADAQQLDAATNPRAWFETRFRPWQLQNPDGNKRGLVTGYYEPLLRGSRKQHGEYTVPVFGPPDDMITVELSELYPELKHMRLRGRIEGKKLVPYYSRAEWEKQESGRAPLLWVDNAIDFFFMQIQGSGQIVLDDGSRIRLGYADQNGHPYRSIGRWLADQGELKIEQASMQGIKAWAEANPKRLRELLNTNPSLVFFRELKAEGSGPPGAMGLPLTPERSIAVDPRHTAMGTPVWLSTSYPGTQMSSEQPLRRLMLAQDTGGAIRGVVRADFYWGSGASPGQQAGKMKQSGEMWILLPREHSPLAP